MADGLWHMEKSLIKTFRVNGNWQMEFVCVLKFVICHWEPHGPLIDWLRKDG